MTDIRAFYFRDFFQTHKIREIFIKHAKIVFYSKIKKSEWLEIIQNKEKLHFYSHLLTND